MSKKKLIKPDKFQLKVNEDDFLIRPIDPKKDLNFILSSWLKSYRNSDFATCISNDTYYAFHQGLISQILTHPTNTLTIIASVEDPDQILGYASYSITKPIIHYIYMKQPFRRLGLGRYLFEGVRNHFKTLEENPVTICTHKCKRWARTSKALNLTYNPYMIGDLDESSKDKI
jgi:hypothetical protein